MRIKSETVNPETRKRIQKSLLRKASTLLDKYKLVRSWVKGNTAFAKAVRSWYDLKIKELSEVSCRRCVYTDCPGQEGMCEGYRQRARKLAIGIGEPDA